MIASGMIHSYVNYGLFPTASCRLSAVNSHHDHDTSFYTILSRLRSFSFILTTSSILFLSISLLSFSLSRELLPSLIHFLQEEKLVPVDNCRRSFFIESLRHQSHVCCCWIKTTASVSESRGKGTITEWISFCQQFHLNGVALDWCCRHCTTLCLPPSATEVPVLISTSLSSYFATACLIGTTSVNALDW